MPIKSKSQLRRFEQLVKENKMSQAELDKWVKETPNLHALPERLHNMPKVTKVKKVKVI